MENPFNPYARPELAIVPQDLLFELQINQGYSEIYLSELLNAYKDTKIFREVLLMGPYASVEVDDSSDIDNCKLMNQWYLQGSLLGIRALHTILGDAFDNRVRQKPMQIALSPGQRVGQKQEADPVAAYLTDRSVQGLENAKAYAQALEGVQDSYCSDPSQLEYFFKGYGFMLSRAADVLSGEFLAMDLKRMELELDTADELDWDNLPWNDQE